VPALAAPLRSPQPAALPIQDLCLYRGGRPNSDRSISGSVNLISEWPGRLQAIVDGRFRRNLSSRSLGNLSGRVFSIDPGKPQDWRGLQPDSTTFKNPQPVAGVSRDARQQHRHRHVVETGDLAHDVRPREVVAALLENLHERVHSGEGVGIAGVVHRNSTQSLTQSHRHPRILNAP
jgi:hypothetical protein